jgi:CubicO group peptidase (beta-lactamase class C family)
VGLDRFVRERVFEPLGMTSTFFRPADSLRARIAPTELTPPRGYPLRGEVHDENAAIMDGVSGHAGLFGSADDLLGFAEWMLEQADRRSGGQAVGSSVSTESRPQPSDRPTVRPSVFAEFASRQNLVPGSSRALGWDTPDSGSSAGTRLSPRSIGHTGFTGTSIWIDPEHHVAIILLSNRVHPTRNNPRWNPVRAAIADLVMTTLFEDLR